MAESLVPEAIDLASVVGLLRDALGPLIEGELIGRTQMRDALVERLGCSQLEAEQLVDTLILRGMLVECEVAGRKAWRIAAS
jgi:hypothetical protein